MKINLTYLLINKIYLNRIYNVKKFIVQHNLKSQSKYKIVMKHQNNQSKNKFLIKTKRKFNLSQYQ
jgi:hypothetical protein